VILLAQSDQRAFDRMEIPGASVTFRKQNKFGFLENFSRPMPLFNITKSGICFASDRRFNTGESVCIDIHIPGEENLRLYGKIKWIREAPINSNCYIGAQFSAFGKGSDYNSIKTLDRLRILQHKYGPFTK
jgi:Tfp pilus assembly protein PilZ